MKPQFVVDPEDPDQVVVARADPYGVENVYYFRGQNAFMFANDFRCLTSLMGFSPSDIGLYAYFWLGFIPAPFSMDKDIKTLEPMSRLTVYQDLQIETSPYHKINFVSEPRSPESFRTSLKTCYKRSLKRLNGPFGVLLSGGLDSSFLTRVASEVDPTLRTFTLGFTHDEYDESAWAQWVAETLGTDHTEISMTPENARDTLEHVGRYYDLPFVDRATWNTCFLLEQIADTEISRTLLDGTGAGSLFGIKQLLIEFMVFDFLVRNQPAFVRTFLTDVSRQSLFHRIPKGLKKGLLRLVGNGTRWPVGPVITQPMAPRFFGEPSHIRNQIQDAMQSWVTGVWPEWESNSLQAKTMFAHIWYLDGKRFIFKLRGPARSLGLTIGNPHLDQEFMNFAMSIPPYKKVENRSLKRPVKKALEKEFSREYPSEKKRIRSLAHRPLQGFGMPLQEWFPDVLQVTDLKAIPVVNQSDLEVSEVGDFCNVDEFWSVFFLNRWLQANDSYLQPEGLLQEVNHSIR